MRRFLSAAAATLLAVVGAAIPAAAAENDPQTPIVISGIMPVAANWETAQDLVNSITVGWNLGNTLDAHPHGFTVADHNRDNWSVSDQETLWGNPETTEAMILAVRDAGFNAIRIPVTWYTMVDAEMNVRADWMHRVQQVVDYAYDNGMIVIINTHHDERLIGLGLLDDEGNLVPQYSNIPARTTEVTMETSELFVSRIWEQISDTFADYNHRLIFECLNEPRTIGSSAEWGGGTEVERANLNKLNQLCVNTIRANGSGYNATRFLMVPTYAAAVGDNAFQGWEMPSDPAGPNRIIVSLHAYVPWRFALDASASVENCPDWGGSPDNDGCINWSVDGTGDQDGPGAIRWALNLARNRFPEYPIIIGEMGALNRDNLEARVAWTQYYNSLATSLGMRVFWWDNGQFAIQQVNGPDNFAIFDRRNLEWPFPELVTALMDSVEPTAREGWGTMARFADVNATHRFFGEINWVAEHGIDTGFHAAVPGTGTEPGFEDFAPNRCLTRAEAGQMLSHVSNFTQSAIRPTDCITRSEFASWLWQAAGSPAASTVRTFSDVSADDSHYKAIQWVSRERIFRFWHEFGPDRTISRGAAAAFMFRAHFEAGVWPALSE